MIFGRKMYIIPQRKLKMYIEPFKTPSGDEIWSGKTANDLGVIANNNILFREHIENIVTSSSHVRSLRCTP